VRVLIVDDEPPARERLRQLLAAHPEVQLVGMAGSAEAALQRLATLAPEQQPELVLLDIQMPGQSGLDLAASWPEPRPAIVFVSAYEQFALQAFAVAASDYLLKPVEPERLAQTLARMHNLKGQQTPALPMRPTQLLIPDRGRTWVLPLAEITWLEAADNYVVVHTAERAPLLRRTLAALLADLGDGFVRTHRSAAVAVAQVRELQAGASGDGLVLLRDGSQVPYSRQHRAALLALLQH
jgi:two-component system, LytTR family, response regulator